MAESYPIEWVALPSDTHGHQAFVVTDVMPVPGGVLVRCIVHVTSNAGSIIENSSMAMSFVPNAQFDMTDPKNPKLCFATRHLDA